MARYLNLSELAYVRHRAAELIRWRRPRSASRVRVYAPRIPAPRRPVDLAPVDLAPVDVLLRVVDGLRRLEVA